MDQTRTSTAVCHVERKEQARHLPETNTYSHRQCKQTQVKEPTRHSRYYINLQYTHSQETPALHGQTTQRMITQDCRDLPICIRASGTRPPGTHAPADVIKADPFFGRSWVRFRVPPCFSNTIARDHLA